MIAPPAQESMPPGFEPRYSGKHNIEETPKRFEVFTQELESSLLGKLSHQTLAHLKTYLKQGQDASPSTPTTPAASTA